MGWRLATRILFIPILAGISIEYIRWTANHLKNPFVQMLMHNLAMQHLTTRTPDLTMLEVAIASFPVHAQGRAGNRVRQKDLKKRDRHRLSLSLIRSYFIKNKEGVFKG
ncbi:MAG: DUF1385 domain-containing protein [Anaerolineales bacterium]|nr:DUF1385 domain-containing protein [Anaerolineales bacterium]